MRFVFSERKAAQAARRTVGSVVGPAWKSEAKARVSVGMGPAPLLTGIECRIVFTCGRTPTPRARRTGQLPQYKRASRRTLK